MVEVQWYPALVSSVHREDPIPHEVGSAIAVADISGPGLATLHFLTDRDMFASYPDWHPSDDRIVFSTYDLSEWQHTDEASNLFTVRMDGSELTELTHHGREETRATQPTWTPDGKRWICSRRWARSSSTAGLSASLDTPRQAACIDADGSNEHVLARIEQRTRGSPVGSARP